MSVRMILKAGNHLLALINDVLNLSQIESGKISLDMENVDLYPIFDEIMALINHQRFTNQKAIRRGQRHLPEPIHAWLDLE